MKHRLSTPIPAPTESKPEKKSVRRLLILVANTLGLAALYYVLPIFGFFYLPHVYLAVGGGLAIWYVIYNKGFQTKGKTPDQLSPTLTLQERQQLIEEGQRRLETSQWAILILLPLLLVFFFDIIYLFMIPEGLFT